MSLDSVKDVQVDGDGMINFFIARVKDADYKEKSILRAGQNVSYQSFERGFLDSDLGLSLAGEGRLKHDKANKSIIIYSSPGPSHKITYSLLKEKFPDYQSIIWRDG